MLALVEPGLQWVPSYRALVEEFRARRERPVPFVLDYPADDADALIARFARDRSGIGLPPGFVPHSTFWLLRDGREVVGVANLRHRLSPELLRHGGHIGYGIRPSARRNGLGRDILKFTLPQARHIGLERVLVTCGRQNEGSARIIVANGGVLESEDYIAERGETVQRYWIEFRP